MENVLRYTGDKNLRLYQPEYLRKKEGKVENRLERQKESLFSEIEMLAPSICDILKRVQKEKPDVMVFLDKGARIFAEPFVRLLQYVGVKDKPEIVFYNDDEEKSGLERDELDEVLQHRDFEKFSGKKMFIIDETISSGKGLENTIVLSEKFEVDFTYFALSHVKEWKNWCGDRGISIDELEQSEKCVVYGYEKDELYLRKLASEYIRDTRYIWFEDRKNQPPKKTIPRYKRLDSKEEFAKFYGLEELSDEEISRVAQGIADNRKVSMQLVKQVKNHVFESVKKEIDNERATKGATQNSI
jgi:adenine/guanine phosphoribosyltransferase-like PRPP-binding protein